MSNYSNRWGRAFGAVLLAGSLGACDFIESTDVNPNAVPVASLDQLFTSAQVNSFFITESELSRIAAVWTQQLAGTDRQFSALDVYQLTEDEIGDTFESVFTGGGLIDIRQAIALAEEAERPVYAGILKIHEAYMIGMLASFVGDIPYSEAVDPEIATPALDEQAEVYAAVQALLDEAIQNLTGANATVATDLNFRGDAAKWIAVANTLKARFYLHWVEAQVSGQNAALAQTACGGNCLDKAIAAAQNGIQIPANNWRTIHSTASTENNIWFQFMSERSGYISAGAFAVDLLRERNDPRLEIFFGEGSGAFAGQIVGSPPGQPAGDPGTAASGLSDLAPFGLGLPQASLPIVSCAENHLILAEAYLRKGQTQQAQQALQQAVECVEARYNLEDIPVNTDLTGPALLEEIITQKYFALFLSPEVLNDFKRTCLPRITENEFVQVEDMPRRFFYAQDERTTNPNIPAPNEQPEANDNDPLACPQAPGL